MTAILSVNNIVKQYSNHLALDHVSLEIEESSIFGLLGPNGAGKTSLIRIINQITAPDEGFINFKGEKLNPSHIPLIGYLPEERGLYKKMEIGEQMIYLARLKGLSRHEAIQRSKYWFEKMDMQKWWKKKVEDLSKGMQQKVQFVATVIHEPRLIILDEPFSGFDPVNADLIKEQIWELNSRGATIIFSTHRMESVEQLCDSIVMLDKSKKILEGKMKDVQNSYRNGTYIVLFEGQEFIQSNDIFEVLKLDLRSEESELIIKLQPQWSLNDALTNLIPQIRIMQVYEKIPTMHEIFVQKIKGIN